MFRTLKLGAIFPKTQLPDRSDVKAQARLQRDRAAHDLMPQPCSDWGTILLHWTLTVSIIASLLTGFRLSSDAEHAWVTPRLEAILPQGEIWTWHFVSAVFVIGVIVAYAAYMAVARLKRRVSWKKTVVLTLPASPKLRWAGFNVIAYWILFGAVLSLTATGILLYLGHGGLVVDIHYISSLVVGGYILCHVIGHYMMGGVPQLLRLFRPQPLRRFAGMARYPLAAALALGLSIALAAVLLDFGSTSNLYIRTVAQLPILDGDLDEAAWRDAQPISVRTQQGSNLGGSGESTVEIRAVRTDTQIAFAFRWQDPTRSLKRHPLIKRADGWYMLNNRADISDETAFYEDKFSVAFALNDAFGSAGSTHMGPKPLANQPGPLHRRGLHYTTDGSILDVWQWKASRGGMIGAVDDMWFGPPKPANDKQVAGKKRYSAGYGADDGKSFYIYNYSKRAEQSYTDRIEVRRLPADHKTTQARLGAIDLSPEAHDTEGSQWWMFEAESVPYSQQKDAEIPVGTIIPGVLIIGEYEGSRADLKGGARWRDGYWTLEVVRALDTGNALDLPMTSGLYMWVSVFDHNQTRHTRHVRPVRLNLR